MHKDAEVPVFVDWPGPIFTPAGKSIKSKKPSQALETWVGNSLLDSRQFVVTSAFLGFRRHINHVARFAAILDFKKTFQTVDDI